MNISIWALLPIAKIHPIEAVICPKQFIHNVIREIIHNRTESDTNAGFKKSIQAKRTNDSGNHRGNERIARNPYCGSDSEGTPDVNIQQK